MRFSEIVFRSLAARIESIIFTNDASVSAGTIRGNQLPEVEENYRGNASRSKKTTYKP